MSRVQFRNRADERTSWRTYSWLARLTPGAAGTGKPWNLSRVASTRSSDAPRILRRSGLMSGSLRSGPKAVGRPRPLGPAASSADQPVAPTAPRAYRSGKPWVDHSELDFDGTTKWPPAGACANKTGPEYRSKRKNSSSEVFRALPPAATQTAIPPPAKVRPVPAPGPWPSSSAGGEAQTAQSR